MAVAVIMKLRLDKYLSEMGRGTRSQVKKEIARGAVLVNGIPAKRPEMKIDTETDCVEISGEAVSYEKYRYYMLNKPAGVISAAQDKKERTVVDLLEKENGNGLFPVGRLDRDTEGLLLITNDGELAHRLLSPKKHVDKLYFARVRGRVQDKDAAKFRQGLDIGDEKLTMPAMLKILQAGECSEVEVTIQEGRFHQVKRMFHAVGKEVTYLKRLRMGPLSLDESLAPGEYRKLTQEEVEALKKTQTSDEQERKQLSC